MCIICYIPTGAELPDIATFERMQRANPDGAGFMYADGRAVHIHKGYGNARILYNDITSVRNKHPLVSKAVKFRLGKGAGVV